MKIEKYRRQRARLWATLYLAIFGDDEKDDETDEEEDEDGEAIDQRALDPVSDSETGAKQIGEESEED